jgi:DNA-binding NarL/FixJ family response regulator
MRWIASIRYVIRKAHRDSVFAPLTVLVYSSDARIRMRVQQALGRLPLNLAAPLDFIGAATQRAVFAEIASGAIDLIVLDGEATPSGGLGLAKQLKDELLQCPPVVVMTARADDAWLADWSRADAVVSRAVDPVALTEAVVPLVQSRLVV